MFDKLKQLKQLKDLQKQLSREVTEIEKNGVKVIINGNMEVQNITLNTELDKAELEKTLTNCVNDAVKQMQMKMAKMMQGMGGLGF